MMKFVRGFFRFVWRLLDGLRRAVHLVLMLFVLMVFLAMLSTAPVIVPQSSALVIAPSGNLVDELRGSALDRALDEARGVERETLVRDLVEAIDEISLIEDEWAREKQLADAMAQYDMMGSSTICKKDEMQWPSALMRFNPVRVLAGTFAGK